MTRRQARRKLDLSRPLYFRRTTRTHGRTFGPRELVPWQELGLQKRTLESWYRQRLISHDPQGENRPPSHHLTDSEGRRLDGPTLEEWVEANYLPENYPPAGWAVRFSPAYDQFSKTGTGPWSEEKEEHLQFLRELKKLDQEGRHEEVNERITARYKKSLEPTSGSPSDDTRDTQGENSGSTAEETSSDVTDESEGTEEASSEHEDLIGDETVQVSETVAEPVEPTPEPVPQTRRGGRKRG